MKTKLIALFFLLCGCAVAQWTPVDQNTNTWGLNGSNSATQLFYPDKGTLTEQFEVVVKGTAPSTLTVTVVGCMRGGTCSSTLATSSGTASQLLSPSTLNIYDKYGVTVSWTGGDATTQFVVNRTGLTARNSSGGSGSGTVSANSGTAGAIANYAAAAGSTTVGPDSLLTDASSVLTYTGNTLVLPVGSITTPSIQASGSASNTGLYWANTSVFCELSAGTAASCLGSTGPEANASGSFGWPASGAASGAKDTTLCRAGVSGAVELNNGSGCGTGGTFEATNYQIGASTNTGAGTYTSITSLTMTGGLVTAISGTSDERLKIFQPYEGGLKQILAITPARYRWNELGQAHTHLPGDRDYVGFIAQDVQRAIPEAITGTEGGYLSFDQRAVVAALVNAVKEQQKEIRRLRSELRKLQTR